MSVRIQLLCDEEPRDRWTVELSRSGPFDVVWLGTPVDSMARARAAIADAANGAIALVVQAVPGVDWRDLLERVRLARPHMALVIALAADEHVDRGLPDVDGVIVGAGPLAHVLSAAIDRRRRRRPVRGPTGEVPAVAARWDWDLTSNLITLSPSWWAQIDEPAIAAPQRPDAWRDRLHHDDVDRIWGVLREARHDPAARVECVYRLRMRTGGHRWMLARGHTRPSPTGEPARLSGTQEDITEIAGLVAQVVRRALHDPLTGLPGRDILLDRVGQSLDRAGRHAKHRFGLLVLDVVGYELVQNALGRAVADSLLSEIAPRLRARLAPGDTLSRLGNREFAVLATKADEEGVDRLLAELDEVMRPPFLIGDQEVFASLAAGVTTSRRRYSDPEEMLRDARLALGRARNSERSRRRAFFNTSVKLEAQQMRLLERGLERAIERGELELRYAPILNLREDRWVGLEAVIGWQHPVRGEIGPAAFMRLAESSGMVGQLGQWALGAVCAEAARWTDPRLRVHLDLAPEFLADERLVDDVAAALDDSGLDPARLMLEIHNPSIALHGGSLAPALDWLDQLGVGLVVDHFGTGRTALGYLARLPLKAAKLDRAFIASVPSGRSAEQRAFRAALALARSLELEVIALDVDRPEQVAHLRELGCHAIQGPAVGPAALPAALGLRGD